MENLFEGRNAAVFLSGSENSGKKFLLRGGVSTREEQGLLILSVEKMLSIAASRGGVEKDQSFTVKGRVVGVHGAFHYDLLTAERIINDMKSAQCKQINFVEDYKLMYRSAMNNAKALGAQIAHFKLSDVHLLFYLEVERSFHNNSV